MPTMSFCLLGSLVLGLTLGSTDSTIDSPNKRSPNQRMLTYSNSTTGGWSRQQYVTLDEFAKGVDSNVQVDRYMRDSLGIRHSEITLEFPTAEAMLAKRDPVIHLLDAANMRFKPHEYRTSNDSTFREISISLGFIPTAQAYFDLRDSLLQHRSDRVRVRVHEQAYEPDVKWDSLQWFLQTLAKTPVREKQAFEDFLFRHLVYRHSTQFTIMARGVNVELKLQVPSLMAQPQEPERNGKRFIAAPAWAAPLRDTPLAIRLPWLEAIGFAALLLSTFSLVLGLFFLWKSRRTSQHF